MMKKTMRTWTVAAGAALVLCGAAWATQPLGYASARGDLTVQELDEVQHWRFLKRYDGPLFEETTKDKANVASLLARADQIAPGNIEDLPAPPPAAGACALDLTTLHQLEHWLWFRQNQAPVFQAAVSKHAEIKDMIAKADGCWCAAPSGAGATGAGAAATGADRLVRRRSRPVRLGQVTTEEILEVQRLERIKKRNPKLYQQIITQDVEERELVTRVEEDPIWPRVRTLTVEQIDEIEYLSDLRMDDPTVYETVIREDPELSGFYRGWEPSLFFPTAAGWLPAPSFVAGRTAVAPFGVAVPNTVVAPGAAAVTPAVATPSSVNVNATNANATNANAVNANAVNANATNANAANANAATANPAALLRANQNAARTNTNATAANENAVNANTPSGSSRGSNANASSRRNRRRNRTEGTSASPAAAESPAASAAPSATSASPAAETPRRSRRNRRSRTEDRPATPSSPAESASPAATAETPATERTSGTAPTRATEDGGPATPAAPASVAAPAAPTEPATPAAPRAEPSDRAEHDRPARHRDSTDEAAPAARAEEPARHRPEGETAGPRRRDQDNGHLRHADHIGAPDASPSPAAQP